MSEFVKAATTSTPPEKSQGDIMGMLHRYGASGFGFRHRGATIVEVSFHLPKPGGQGDNTVTIPIDIAQVHKRLLARHDKTKRVSRAAAPGVDQAERVAWRILYLWVDAALAAVSIGAQTIEEAFFAHLIVADTDGQEGRVIDYIHTLQKGVGVDGQLPAGRLLLGSGK